MGVEGTIGRTLGTEGVGVGVGWLDWEEEGGGFLLCGVWRVGMNCSIL